MSSGSQRPARGSADMDWMFQAAVAQSPNAVVFVELNGDFLWANGAACALTGLTRENVTSWTVTELIAEASHQPAREYLRTAVREGRVAGELDIRHVDGSERRCQVEATLIDEKTLIAYVWDISRQVAALKTASEHAAQLRAMFDSVQDMMFFKDRDLRYTHANPAALAYMGLSKDQVVGATDAEIFDSMVAEEIAAADQRVLAGSTDKALVIREIHGQQRILETIKVPVCGADGEVVGLCGVSRDLTDLRRLEEQLRQSQKLEAIGRLAGGVAHDFNNLLTPILGYTGMLQDSLSGNEQAQCDLAAIERAGTRARDLTANLLAFSRKQVLDKSLVNLNDVVEGLLGMLSRLLREDVPIRLALQDDLGVVQADVAQLQNVLVNLTINAADAMPDGGTMTIETQDVTLDDEYVKRHPGASVGPHVMLAVTDTGCGMDVETRRRAFEPFFTTKPVDEGTGLGLATVHGIVKQHGGGIEVYSELEHGASFKIYLPRRDAPPVDLDEQPDVNQLRGTERVLVVEDDEAVRLLTAAVLEKYGYHVTALAEPSAATGLAATVETPFDLLVTDVVLPGMNGAQLHRALRGPWPALPVLYMSGYTRNVIAHHGVLAEGLRFLQKPFQPGDLLLRVREVLDETDS